VAARPPSAPRDADLSLAMAVVAASSAPLVLLDEQMAVIAASTSFFRTFGIDPKTAPGRRLRDLGSGEWNVPQLHALLAATLSGYADVEAYEMDLKRAGKPTRLVVVNADKLVYGDAAQVRLLMSVADVTDARAAEKLKDDLLREKGVLLQELQHRVANSLQIIASVLLQDARHTQSAEIRDHLNSAHNRVMSVAALQQQLAAASLGDVELRAYFTRLCESIGASMIRDHEQLLLSVTVDESVVGPDVSVSLGLVVTELVINALKHAFPDRRQGRIAVDYKSRGPNWTLSVGDDGVGMPKDPEQAKPGLGSSIVEALAKQLGAHIVVADTKPGTTVSLVHAHIAMVPDQAKASQSNAV
jgi:two-component sensor histidine kinase